MDPMSILADWGQVIMRPLGELGSQILGFLPNVLSALVVLVLGLIVLRVLTRIVQQILDVLQVDNILAKLGVSDELKKVGIKMSFSKLLAKVVEIFLALVLLIVVVDLLGMEQLNDFINQVLAYIPNVFVAIVILGFGMAVGKIVQNVCVDGSAGLDLNKKQAKMLGQVANASILIFSAMAALVQLGIGEGLIQTFFTGIVAMFAIAGGIAFGLGGKEKAAEMLGKVGK